MSTSAKSLYLDSSALVKLVLVEAESSALAQVLTAWPSRCSCALARVEVVRAVAPHGASAVERARSDLGNLTLIELDDTLLDDAALLGPLVLRTLDAVHLAAARLLGDQLGAVATYDIRMSQAAESLDLPVISPGKL